LAGELSGGNRYPPNDFSSIATTAVLPSVIALILPSVIGKTDSI
jgi:hypothetical protein